jgi:hypothetical protein
MLKCVYYCDNFYNYDLKKIKFKKITNYNFFNQHLRIFSGSMQIRD